VARSLARSPRVGALGIGPSSERIRSPAGTTRAPTVRAERIELSSPGCRPGTVTRRRSSGADGRSRTAESRLMRARSIQSSSALLAPGVEPGLHQVMSLVWNRATRQQRPRWESNPTTQSFVAIGAQSGAFLAMPTSGRGRLPVSTAWRATIKLVNPRTPWRVERRHAPSEGAAWCRQDGESRSLRRS
jgi:hypothetical protein